MPMRDEFEFHREVLDLLEDWSDDPTGLNSCDDLLELRDELRGLLNEGEGE